MLEYIGVALKLGSQKNNQLVKDFFISLVISCVEGGDAETTQTHQESQRHRHDMETIHDCFNSAQGVTLRNCPELANILIQDSISLFCR